MAKPDLQKHTLNLRAGDWDYITARFARDGHHTSTIVRSVVSKFVDALQDQDEQAQIKMDIDL